MNQRVKETIKPSAGAGTAKSGKRPAAVMFLYVLQFFLGVGAIGGGLALIIDPSGSMMGMPADTVLQRSPFSSFLFPGILLLAVFGVFPLLVLYGMVKRPRWAWADAFNPFKELHSAWTLSLYVGFGQIIWIMVETYIMNAVSLVHVFYMSLGLLIQIATLLPSVQRFFQLPHGPGSYRR
ncbi:hypothetical protein SAMN04487895_107268 [Paenibacillus sophorae]|uniref:Uncharacterized protein n=2 Tax=Paenibacillus sophorae TaxID=1333845 RepID=A0A1H8PMF6_9BACL|nr:hypothetical protein [Paenibacillus sophorae]SEO43140.1 hypothetical protein SAMN04487895_107268 [Paenibacillus sophorae]